mgnify:FL=1
MILCCGEALIDFMPLEKADSQIFYKPCPGGSSLNTAVALGRLNHNVGMLTGISNDLFGKQLIAHLEESNVDCSLVVRSNLDTTLAFVSAESLEGNVEYAFYAKETADRSISVENLPKSLPDNIEVLEFGSISLVMEPSASSYEHLMFRESTKRFISLDPNIRPDFIPDALVFQKRFDSWLDHVDLLKLSDADLEWLYPNRNIDDAVSHILSKKVQAVFLTMGEKGASAYTKNHQIFAKTPFVSVKDTVGAGDSFHAGLLYKLAKMDRLKLGQLKEIKEPELKASLQFAMKVAALTCTNTGASPPKIDEISPED